MANWPYSAPYKPPQIDWSDVEIERIGELLKAIAHPLRLSIVCLLGEGERSVGDISQEIGSSQPNISQHLSLLSNRKLLKSRKDANRIYYRIADERLISIISMLRGIYCP
ncbi:metalloregulator ArsR/SmtB family transcription factor [Azonexus sp.]|uniref:ArsR/SmtB family transcription factor n=1 Tax=Azonexus sp. TaxID=1872668 RepID=UPI0027BA55B9|nr:metalloregulator ArsR/SmtB family transcription factor [Azonexus sp.]